MRLARICSFFASVLIAALSLDGFELSAARSVQTDSVIVVNTLIDEVSACAGIISLRCAIMTANTAASPTAIMFSISGTITVGSPLIIDNANQPITIDGSGQSIVVDGASSTQVFNVNTGTVTLNDLTISHGATTVDYSGGYGDGNGGGVYHRAGTLIISNSTLSFNDAFSGSGGNGGAVFNYAGTSVISNSVLLHNSAFNVGGGVYNSAGMIAINNSTVSSNEAQSGGGVFNSGGSVTINVSTISGNGAQSGGGVYNGFNTSDMTISNSTLSNNMADLEGGGAVFNTTTLLMTNSTLTGNTGGSGGAVNAFSGTLAIASSSLVSNSAQYYGGGLFSKYAIVNLLSTIVAKNAGPTGPDIDTSNAINSFGHNLIGDGSGSLGLINGTRHDQVGTSASPINPGLAALANNGGSTQTLAINSGSPAISAGDCTGARNASSTVPAIGNDQRGVIRHSPCDVGAYESSFGSHPRATVTYTSIPSKTATATATRTSTHTPTPTSEPFSAKIDTIGVYRAGMFYLRLHNTTGIADLTVGFTAGTKPYPIVGDWTGAGYDTVGIFDRNNGQFTLCTANVTIACANVADQKSLILGVPDDMPLAGRWLLTATTAGVGVFRPPNGLIYLKNTLTTGYSDYTMVLGIPGDTGLTGDWSGKGFDSPGVYRPGNSTFYLSNQVTNGSVYGDYQVQYGLSGRVPITGDWIAQGHDGIGLFQQNSGLTYLKNQLITGYADNIFTYGIAGDIPIAGHWQTVYPPIAPAPVLIARTAVPNQSNGNTESNNPIGD